MGRTHQQRLSFFKPPTSSPINTYQYHPKLRYNCFENRYSNHQSMIRPRPLASVACSPSRCLAPSLRSLALASFYQTSSQKSYLSPPGALVFASRQPSTTRTFSHYPSRANVPPPGGRGPSSGFPLGNIFGQQQERKPGDALKQFGIDLTQKAREGKLDPVVGRTEEIKRTIQILSRRTKVSA